MDAKKKRPGPVVQMLRWIGMLILLVFVLFILLQLTGARLTVDGTQMSTSLAHGDTVIVNRIAYLFTDPARFDIVAFPFAYQEDTFYERRVIGLPGETVQITGGTIYINGVGLTMREDLTVPEQGGLASKPVTLGSDEYFVLCDNPSGGSDSREPTVGNVRKQSIIGKVWLRVWPLPRFGLLR